MGIYVKFWNFYHACSPNIAMSRDPKSKFRKNLIFFLILHLILGKVTKFLEEKRSTSEVISQKPHGVWKTPPPQCFRVKKLKKDINVIDITSHDVPYQLLRMNHIPFYFQNKSQTDCTRNTVKHRTVQHCISVRLCQMLLCLLLFFNFM